MNVPPQPNKTLTWADVMDCIAELKMVNPQEQLHWYMQLNSYNTKIFWRIKNMYEHWLKYPDKHNRHKRARKWLKIGDTP